MPNHEFAVAGWTSVSNTGPSMSEMKSLLELVTTGTSRQNHREKFETSVYRVYDNKIDSGSADNFGYEVKRRRQVWFHQTPHNHTDGD
jgi:hypothetical protein